MSRRTQTIRERRVPRAAAFLLAAGALIAASCGADRTDISFGGPTTARAASTSAATTMVPGSTTTSAIEATGGAGETTTTFDPSTPPISLAVPTTVPGTPPDHVVEGDTATAPPPEVVRPPASWIGFGQPQPSSMFENLRDDHSLDGKGKFVAITFDDGPSKYTPQIVDILRFMGVQGTFFQIAEQALARPDDVRLMILAGMQIGSHSRNHAHLREAAPDIARDEVIGSIDDMNATFGAGTVTCFRPPYAEYDQRTLDEVSERGAAMAMWSLDTLDWKKPAWQTLVNRVVNGAQDRDILLFHDGGGDRTQTILALPWIIQGLRDKGFQFMPVC